jgi:hypothetical protein
MLRFLNVLLIGLVAIVYNVTVPPLTPTRSAVRFILPFGPASGVDEGFHI